MKKTTSLTGKAKTLLNDGIDPLAAGMAALRQIDPATEELAKKRAKQCQVCDHIEDEPVKSLAISDTRIPEISNKMCGLCFCALPLKTRQSIKPCELWQE